MIIRRSEERDYGGVSVWVQPDDARGDRDPCHEIYLAPHRLREAWDGRRLTPEGERIVADVMAARLAGEAEARKRAEIDAALDAEFTRRKEAVADLYDRDAARAVGDVFDARTLEASR